MKRGAHHRGTRRAKRVDPSDLRPSLQDIDRAIEQIRKNDLRVMHMNSRTQILLPALIAHRSTFLEE